MNTQKNNKKKITQKQQQRIKENIRINYKKCSDNNTNNRLNYCCINFILNFTGIKNINNFMDIGSQEGQFADILSKKIKINNIYCIDNNQKTVSDGKIIYPQYNWKCIDFNKKEQMFNIKFDLITIINTFYYLYTDQAIKNIKLLLNSGKYLLLSYGDDNFSKINITDDQIINRLENNNLKLMSIIKTFEKVNNNTDYHITANRWYTCILLKKFKKNPN